MLPLALLIDGENVSAKFLAEVERHVAPLGDLVTKCVFGDFSDKRLSEWVGAARKHGLELVFQVSGGKGKNSTDIALTIRAMELLHDGNIDGFCLVSSDRDFIPLMIKLRQYGKKVYGFGEAKADAALRCNLTQFFILESSPSKIPTAPVAKIDNASKPLDPKIIGFIRSLSEPDPDGLVHLSTLAAVMRQNAPNLADRFCGKGKFLKNLMQTGQIDRIGAGGAIRIRLRQGSAAKVA